MPTRRLRRRKLLQAGAAAAIFAPAIVRAQGTIVLRWGDVQAPNHPSVLAAVRAAQEVKEKTGGRIEIQSFPSGQLGGSRDMVEAVGSGALTMVTEGGALIGQFLPQISIIEAPYIWKDAAQMARALSSPLMDEFNTTLVAKREMRIVATNYYGKRHVTSGSRAVKTVADMQGFKLRVPQVDTFVAMAEAWGAKPTAMDFSELYLALSQGAVDGEENPLPTIQSGKLFEVQKYLILTGHVITPRLVMVNEPAWKKMSAADQAIVLAAVRAGAAWNDTEIAAQEATLADSFTKAGMTVIQPNVESFRKPVLATVPQKFEAKWGKGLFEKLQAM